MSGTRALMKMSWMDNNVYDNIREDRDYLYKLLKEKVPERWYYGHYHDSFSGTLVNTQTRGLDIHELIEVTYYED